MEVLYKRTLHKLKLAVRIIDDFTGKVVSNAGYRFYINDIPVHPEKKADGYFIITGEQSEPYSLKITSPWYCAYTANITSGFSNNDAPHNVRMLPGYAYPMLSGVTAYRGTFSSGKIICPEGIDVKLMAEMACGRIKLKSIDKRDGKTSISLLDPDGKDRTGMTIALNGDNTRFEAEIFTLESRLEGCTYITGANIKKAYQPGTPILRVYRAITDSRGRVLIPVENGPAPDFEVQIQAEYMKNKISGKRLLTTGKITDYNESF